MNSFLKKFLIRPAKSGTKNSLSTRELETLATTPTDVSVDFQTDSDREYHYVIQVDKSGDVGTATYRWFRSDFETGIVWSDDLQTWQPSPQVIDDVLTFDSATLYYTTDFRPILDSEDFETTDTSLVSLFEINQRVEDFTLTAESSYTVLSADDVLITMGPESSRPSFTYDGQGILVQKFDGSLYVDVESKYIEGVDGVSGAITFSSPLTGDFRVTYFSAQEVPIDSVQGLLGTGFVDVSAPTSGTLVMTYRTFPSLLWEGESILTGTSVQDLDGITSVRFKQNGLSKQDYTFDSTAEFWIPKIQRGPYFDYINFLPPAVSRDRVHDVRARILNNTPLPDPTSLSRNQEWIYDESTQRLSFTGSSSLTQAVSDDTIGISLSSAPLVPTSIQEFFSISGSSFTVSRAPILDGGNLVTNDPNDVSVFVNGVQVVPSSIDGLAGTVVLPTPATLSDSVSVEYYGSNISVGLGVSSLQREVDYKVDESSGTVTFCKIISNEYPVGAVSEFLNSPVSDSLRVFVTDGLSTAPLLRGVDFTVSGSTLNFTSPVAGDVVILYDRNVDYSLDRDTGEVTLLRDVHDGDSITAKYRFYVDTPDNSAPNDGLRDDLLDPDKLNWPPTSPQPLNQALGGEQTFNLKNRNVVPGTLELYRNGSLVSPESYRVQYNSGFVQLLLPLNQGDTLEAVYSYVEFREDAGVVLVERCSGNTSISLPSKDVYPETLVLKITDGTVTAEINSSLYTFDRSTSVVTFLAPLDDSFVPQPTLYPKFNALGKSLLAEYKFIGNPVNGEIVVESASGISIGDSVFLENSDIVEGSLSLSLKPKDTYTEDVSSQADGSNTVFSLTYTPVVSSPGSTKASRRPSDIEVRVNGVPVLVSGLEGSLGQVQLGSAPLEGDFVTVEYHFSNPSSEVVPLVERVSIREEFVGFSGSSLSLTYGNIVVDSGGLNSGVEQLVFDGDVGILGGDFLQINQEVFIAEKSAFDGVDTRVMLTYPMQGSYVSPTVRRIPSGATVSSTVTLEADLPVGSNSISAFGDLRSTFVPGSLLVIDPTGTKEVLRISNSVYDAEGGFTNIFFTSTVKNTLGYSVSTDCSLTYPVVDEGTTSVFFLNPLLDSLVLEKWDGVNFVPLVGNVDYVTSNGTVSLVSPLVPSDKVRASYRAYNVLPTDEGSLSIEWFHYRSRPDINEIEVDYDLEAPDSFYFKVMSEDSLFEKMREEQEEAEERNGAAGFGPGPFNNDTSLESKGFAGPVFRLRDKVQREYIVQRVAETFNDRVNAFESLRRSKFGFVSGGVDGILVTQDIEDSKDVGGRLHPVDDPNDPTDVYTTSGYDGQNIADLPVLSSGGYELPVDINTTTNTYTKPVGVNDDTSFSEVEGYTEDNEVYLGFAEKSLMQTETTHLSSLKSINRCGPCLGRHLLGAYLVGTSPYREQLGLVGKQPHYQTNGSLNNNTVFTVESLSSNQDNRKSGLLILHLKNYVSSTVWDYSGKFYQVNSSGFVEDTGIVVPTVPNGSVLDLTSQIGVSVKLMFLGAGTPPSANSVFVLPMGYPYVGSGFPRSYTSFVSAEVGMSLSKVIDSGPSYFTPSSMFTVRPFALNKALRESFTITKVSSSSFNVGYGSTTDNLAPTLYRTGGLTVAAGGLFLDFKSSTFFVINSTVSGLDSGDSVKVSMTAPRAWSLPYSYLYKLVKASNDTGGSYDDHLWDIYSVLSDLETSNAGIVYGEVLSEDFIIDTDPYYIVGEEASIGAEVRRGNAQSYYTDQLDPASASYLSTFKSYFDSLYYSLDTGVDNSATNSFIDLRISNINSRLSAIDSRLSLISAEQQGLINQMFDNSGSFEGLLERRKTWLNLLLHLTVGVSRQRIAEQTVQSLIAQSVQIGSGAFNG